jgi:hypothetical protein
VRKKIAIGFLAVFLAVATMIGVTSVVVTNFGIFCTISVSSDPANNNTSNNLKTLGFAGPGAGFNSAQQPSFEWQLTFGGECPAAPAGYVSKKVAGPQGQPGLGEVWEPAPIAAFTSLKVQESSGFTCLILVIALFLVTRKKAPA